MALKKTLIYVSAVLTGLVAIGASPKLRAGAKLATLFAAHGLPKKNIRAFLRLESIASVDPKACATTGRLACYLVDQAETDANLEAYENSESWEKDHVSEWFEMLKEDDDTVDWKIMIQDILSETFTTVISSRLTIMEVKNLMGAAFRSIDDEVLTVAEVGRVFEYLDKNKNGELDAGEMVGSMSFDCTDQSTNTLACSIYVYFFKDQIEGLPVNRETYVARMIYSSKQGRNWDASPAQIMEVKDALARLELESRLE